MASCLHELFSGALVLPLTVLRRVRWRVPGYVRSAGRCPALHHRVFNPRWTPHARFHAVSAVATNVGWSIVCLWLLWRPGTPREQQVALKIAALCPVLNYAPFFIAVAVPGSEAEDEPGQAPRVAGVPVNLVAAGVMSGLSARGYLLACAADPACR